MTRDEIDLRAWVLKYLCDLEGHLGALGPRVDTLTEYLLSFDHASRSYLQGLTEGGPFTDDGTPEILDMLKTLAALCGLRPGVTLPGYAMDGAVIGTSAPAASRLKPVYGTAEIPHAAELQAMAPDDLSSFTFALVKSQAVHCGYADDIMADARAYGFDIFATRHIQPLDAGRAGTLYVEHANKPYFTDLLRSVCGQAGVVALLLRYPNAVAAWRALCGATSPAEAAPGTLRRRYGLALPDNAVHGSDSSANVVREAMIFFEKTSLPVCFGDAP